MNIHNQTIAKINQMPESLVKEVSDYIDFLLWKHGNSDSSTWLHSKESMEIVESDFSDYLSNLEDYENRLALGEIKW
ncbi:MAG: DUF2281 domain-containing protein [Scytonematopsis contorta HA4267-MV1]|jgi:hypothetical protein|nr:DUF2281 domain-containing protein [Scytonematopsis contorta HA4267-MV1]